MRKIINGKLYDTITAEELGSATNGYYRNDNRYYEETLYQKRNKEFFLLGEGNAGSKYRCRSGSNNWFGDTQIVPITTAEAQDWVENNLTVKAYIEIFGMPSEGDDNVSVTIDLPAEVEKKIRESAENADIGFEKYIEKILCSSI